MAEPAALSARAQALSSTAPGFIAHFFASSRLHHLSTWKLDLSDMVQSHMAQSPVQYQAAPVTDPYRVIMHIDMDCFFASVGIRDRPHLRDKPVAVAHSINAANSDNYSSSEIASCNYVARTRGLRNGMFLGQIRAQVPDLVIIPYEFDKYDACSRALYRILLEACDYVQAVSCDEVYVDATYVLKKRMAGVLAGGRNYANQLETAAVALAHELRQRIAQATGCTASVGIAHNLLLARIATTRAKPDGVQFLAPHMTLPTLAPLRVQDLPGMGSAIARKCTSLGLHTCAEVRIQPLPLLQQALGEKTAETLHAFALGDDNRPLQNKPRQTLGADINWGIRFSTDAQVADFLREFSEEVFARLTKAGYRASHVTVNAKKRLYEGEPHKFLGCGHCEDHSRSLQTPQALGSSERLYVCVLALYQQIGLTPDEVRGVGIHLKRLQPLLHPMLAGRGESTSKQTQRSPQPTRSRPLDDLLASPDSAASEVEESNPTVGAGRRKGATQTTMFAFAKPVPGAGASSHVPAATLPREPVAFEYVEGDLEEEEMWREDEDTVDSLPLSPLEPFDVESLASYASSASASASRSGVPSSEGTVLPALSSSARVSLFETVKASSTTAKASKPLGTSQGGTHSRPRTAAKDSNGDKGGKTAAKRGIAAFFQSSAGTSLTVHKTGVIGMAAAAAEEGDDALLASVDKSVWNALPDELKREQLELLRHAKRQKS